MPFTLRVSFHGMNLFVREGTTALHVLMPATGSDCGCDDPHAPRLIVNTAYLRPGQTELDGMLAHSSLQNRSLELPQAGNALDTALPAGLAKLGPVRDDVVSGADTTPLAARVLVRNGTCSDYARGACWNWQGQVQRLAHVIEWTVTDVPGESLALPLQLLSGAYGGTIPTLYPVNGVVEMEIWHAPHAELPPDSVIPPPPAAGADAPHFAGFGVLLQAPLAEVPTYAPDACPPIDNPGRYDAFRGAVTYSCVRPLERPANDSTRVRCRGSVSPSTSG